MDHIVTALGQDETTWTAALLLILLGTYVTGSAVIAATRRHRSPGLPYAGRRKLAAFRDAPTAAIPITAPRTAVMPILPFQGEPVALANVDQWEILLGNGVHLKPRRHARTRVGA